MASNELGAHKKPSQRKLWWPIIVAVGGLYAVMALVKQPALPSVKCGRDVAASEVSVTMLGATWCGYCAKARRFFVNENVSYCEYDIELTQTGARMYRDSRLQGIPIMYVGDEVIVGFNRHEVMQALVAGDLLDLDKL